MPSRKSGTTRRKHSLGNLRRAHPASGATWNVQVVRGKMSSKCLWHACRALILGLTLMLLGAGMATIGYYADQLSVGSEIRGNATVRVKNESKGFHLNNLSYVGPIVMGFGGFIVVASCVMTFEARDSAAKVVPARLKATTNNKTNVRSNQSSAASQRRAAGIQHQASRWDHHLGVFRSSPAEPLALPPPPLDRQALTAALVHFSKSISTSARFSPQHRRLSHTGSVPNLSTIAPHPYANSTSISQLLSPNRKSLYPVQKRHRHHHHHHPHTSSNGRQMKSRGTRISSSLVARNTRESSTALPMPLRHRLYWHAMSIDENGRATTDSQASRIIDRTKRSDTAKRHVFTRQKPIEQDEEQRRAVEAASPLGKRRSSTMSDSSHSGRWTYRCASITSRASSIDSRKVQVDLHSPDTVPKSILRSPKRFNSGTSTTPSVEKEFRSQLSVCSEPPVPIRQLSGQSSLEPCLREESPDIEEIAALSPAASPELPLSPQSTHNVTDTSPAPADTPTPASSSVSGKKARPATLPLKLDPSLDSNINDKRSFELHKLLHRSNSSRAFYRAKPKASLDEHDDSIFYIESSEKAQTNGSDDSYDSLRVINERRHKLLKTGSETALSERRTNYDHSGRQNGATRPESVWVELSCDVRPAEQPELWKEEREESSASVTLTMESAQKSAASDESQL